MTIFKPGDYVKCNRTGVEGFLEAHEGSSYTLSLAGNTYTASGRYSTQDTRPCLEHIYLPTSDVFEVTKLTPDKQLIYFKELSIYVYDSPNGVIQLTKEQTL